METTQLKSFATWARTSLIREVAARIAVVLAPASPERVEQPKAVEALEKAVTSSGGGDDGRAAVADKVAYTWFNRIIALRFMDANGYTGVGVVSPQVGVETGQPEVLAEAKRGNIDTGVVAGKTGEIVTSLLNGTRRSADAQGEAYALLLADYCRHWNCAMPFMFEREGDFTELLIPGNLLADDSVPSRAVKVLTKDVCQDVEVIGWLYQFYISERKDEVFAGFKKNKKAGADEIPAATQLFTPHWIVRYLVENSLGRLWMLNRPSSRLVDQMQYYIPPVDEETEFLKISRPEELKVVDPACGSGHMLTYAFDLLYAIYAEEGYAPAEIPGLILTHNLYGVEIDPRAGALAAFALTMKARAKQRTYFSKRIEPNICVLDPIRFTPDEIDFLLTGSGDKHAEAAFWNQFENADTYGSLIRPDPHLTALLKQHVAQLYDGGDILLADVLDWAERVIEQAEYLLPGYVVVVANPPYMGSKNFDSNLNGWAKAKFPSSKSDLFAMFIERSLSLLSPRGYAATVTMDSWMFQGAYEALRKAIVQNGRILGLVHMPYDGKGRTSMGINFGTVASVIASWRDSTSLGEFATVRHFELDEAGVPATFPPDGDRLLRRAGADFAGLPGSPIAFWASKPELAVFKRYPLAGELAELRHGMSTSDNDRFLRQWHEVSRSRLMTTARSGSEALASGVIWFPFCKGGDLRRWYGNLDYVVNWYNNGREIKDETNRKYPYLNGKLGFVIGAEERYFQPAVTWSSTTSSDASFRFLPAGSIVSNRGQTMYPTAAGVSLDYLLGVMNSSVSARFLSFLSPTLGYELGYVAKTPIPNGGGKSEIEIMVRRLVEIARADWDSFETSWDFSIHPLMSSAETGALAERLARLGEIWAALEREALLLESEIDRQVAEGLDLALSPEGGQQPRDLTLKRSHLAKCSDSSDPVGSNLRRGLACELISYSVGCMFGRYSLNEPGLILADQGSTVREYLSKVPDPTFAPDTDNVIPIVDGDWFEDDMVARFRTFLRVAFGEQHFEENLRFVTESLGVKDIRDYFVRSFYKDHVQRYKKRPIYWLFSSPKGSFNALIYMHRYTPSTVSTVLNEYLREFTAKLSSSLQQQERLAAGGGTPRQQAAAQKEADRLRKVLLELEEYEHDVLYPLASRQLAIDLDDGVKANYPKFGTALKKIPGLEASDE